MKTSAPKKVPRAAQAGWMRLAVLPLVIVSMAIADTCGAEVETSKREAPVYLFTSFRANGEDGLRFLHSHDGYKWTNVPGTFLRPQVGPSRIMRDPSMVRGPDGTFHLVWTTGWRSDQGFGYASSKDLVHWSGQRFVPVMEHEPTTVNVWAPEIFHDEAGQQFIICWASTIPGRYPDELERRDNNHRMYYTTTRDFETFTPARLFIEPGFSVIDGTIVKNGDRYVIVHKDNSRPHLNLRVAFANGPLGPWSASSNTFTEQFTEGPTLLTLGEDWLIYFDMYRAHRYGAVRTRDFKTFANVTDEVSFPKEHRHGTVLTITRADLDRLLNAGGTFLPAFPGAEGFGAKATGGRGGRVIAVTNLNDAGPGSLRAAVDETGPRTIVFRVSGNIPLESSLKLRHGDLTIAGQTAPGDGICLQNYSLDLAGASNVIVRHLRVRPGDVSGQDLDALGGRSGEDIIIDHCSMSWSIDECLSIYSGVRNLTVQWCLLSESLYQSNHVKGRHGYGGIWGGQNASWHHNLLAHHSSRNPRIVGKSVGDQFVDMRNNVIYNWGFNSTYGGDGDVRVNLVNNIYKPGPATRDNVHARVANPSPGAEPRNWWIAGNLAIGSPEVTTDNWLGVHPTGATTDSLRAGAPFAAAPVTTQTAAAAFETVLKGAGAILPRRDSLDARVVEEARTGTARFGETYDGGGKGIIDSQKVVGGWPELHAAPAPADTDSDGMPDEWEQRFKLDSRNPTDGAQDADGDGYTNLEEYLNDTDPTEYFDYTLRW